MDDLAEINVNMPDSWLMKEARSHEMKPWVRGDIVKEIINPNFE